MRPSWSHFGEVGVFQLLGATWNKMLQGQNKARVRMSMGTRGKENLRPRDSSGCVSFGEDLEKGKWKIKRLYTFG